jgi:hypothetical protein
MSSRCAEHLRKSFREFMTNSENPFLFDMRFAKGRAHLSIPAFALSAGETGVDRP